MDPPDDQQVENKKGLDMSAGWLQQSKQGGKRDKHMAVMRVASMGVGLAVLLWYGIQVH